jgi:predicted transcriptional regulator YdeE
MRTDGQAGPSVQAYCWCMTQLAAHTIIGPKCTTNETTAMQDIGALWAAAIAAGFGAPTMYAVYRNYHVRPGGHTVEVVVGRLATVGEIAGDVPGPGAQVVTVPAQHCHHVVTDGSVADVQRAWAHIWAQWPDGGPRSFIADLEHWVLGSNGQPQRADLFIGLRSDVQS